MKKIDTELQKLIHNYDGDCSYECGDCAKFISKIKQTILKEIEEEKSTMAHIVGTKRVETDYITLEAIRKILGK